VARGLFLRPVYQEGGPSVRTGSGVRFGVAVCVGAGVLLAVGEADGVRVMVGV
jgi:hypothetical protein